MPKNYVSNKPETPQLFESKFMEFFSHTHPAVPAILYLPVVLIFLYLTFFQFDLNVVYSIILFFAGIFFWSFTEYNLHRFVFHWVPESDLGKKLHFIMHGVHHDYPNDPKRLVMPPVISIPLAVFFYFVFYFIIGKHYSAPFFSGFVLGYVYYDTMHYAVHHFPLKNKFFLNIKKHHMKHHYQNEDLGYGVSSPFWDKIYRTDFPKTQSEGTVVGN